MKKYLIILLAIIMHSITYAQDFFSFSNDYRIKSIAGYTTDDDRLFIKHEFEYNGSGYLSKQMIQDNSWRSDYEIDYYYDSSGRILRAETDLGMEGGGQVAYYAYEDTSNGYKVLITYTYPGNSDEEWEERVYNKDGLLLENSFTSMFFYSYYIYEYGELGNLVKKKDGTGTFNSFTEYYYNDQGQIIGCAQGSEDYVHTEAAYDYNRNGKLSFILYDIEIPELNSFIEYDDIGNISEIRKREMYEGETYYIIEWEPGTPNMEIQTELFYTLFIFFSGADYY